MSAIVLGGVPLPTALVWVDRYVSATVDQSIRRTLGGVVAIHAKKLSAGRPITLEARPERGWMDKATVLAVSAMAEDPTGVYTLVFGSDNYQVVFRHSDAPAFEAVPLVPRIGDGGLDVYISKIKLLTV